MYGTVSSLGSNLFYKFAMKKVILQIVVVDLYIYTTNKQASQKWAHLQCHCGGNLSQFV